MKFLSVSVLPWQTEVSLPDGESGGGGGSADLIELQKFFSMTIF